VLGSEFEVHAEVELGELAPTDVRVQVMVGQVTSNRELVNLDLHDLEHTGEHGLVHVFRGKARCDHPGHKGYIVRVVPHNEDVKVATELSLMSWEKS